MPRIRYKVTLEEPERQMLKEITTRGRHSSQKVLNALILLKCDEGRFQDRKLTNQAIADVLPVSLKKIDRVKRRLVEQGLEGGAGQTQARTHLQAESRRRLRSASDRGQLWQAAPRARPLVVAPAGRPHGGTGIRRRSVL